MPRGLVDVRLSGHVLELAAAEVVIKNILRARKALRSAHNRNAFPHARRPLTGRGRGCEIEINVIGDHQIQQSVAIVVNERAACTPSFSRTSNSRGFSDFFERAVLVVIKAVLPVIGDVKVFPSVVVVVADAHSLSPACGAQTRLRSYVTKGSVVIVAIQMADGSFARGKAGKCGSVYKKNIRPTIVVIIEDRHPGSGGFDNVFLGLHAAEDVLHRESGFLSNIYEGRDWRLLRLGLRLNVSFERQ